MDSPRWETAIADLQACAESMRRHASYPKPKRSVKIDDNVHLIVRGDRGPLLVPQWLVEMSDDAEIDAEARRHGFDGYMTYEIEEAG